MLHLERHKRHPNWNYTIKPQKTKNQNLFCGGPLEFNIAVKGKIGIPVILTQSAGATFKIIAKWKGSEKK